jgi:hypothetical protein
MAAAVGVESIEAPSLPGIDRGLVHPTSPGAGHLFVQGRVDGVLFDDVHGVGWRLVAIRGEAHHVDPAELAWFESIGGRTVDVAETDAVYSGWFAERSVTCAVQRPDFRLYGTATDGDAASLLLADLRSHIAVPSYGPTDVPGGPPTPSDSPTC